MVLQFKSITINNFCSYANATIDLSNKGFCLVSGRNNFVKDNAISNGSGKSTIWSAICYTLTGETLLGIKTNLKNINSTADSCYTSLIFFADTDEYIITRYISPKADLKISKNGIDISGKGLRESEKILGETLPDLTKDLIASTIILGQGMPNKFSSFSPSGRKDLLERLTKSEFMIEDIKNRISTRISALNDQIREYEDSILVNNTKLATLQKDYENVKADLASIKGIKFKSLISKSEASIEEYKANLNEVQQNENDLEKETDDINTKILTLTTEKSKVNDEEFQAYSTKQNEVFMEKNTKQLSINFLNTEINKMKSIKDVCPTCGQKIPGVLKPDTTEKEAEIKKLTEELKILDDSLTEINNKHKEYILQIEETYNEIEPLKKTYKDNKSQLTVFKNTISDITKQLDSEKEKLLKLKYDQENNEKILNALKQKESDFEVGIKQLQDAINITDLAKIDTKDHLAVVKKIDSLVKRDFRGYLLYNIIEYLNNKAKEYSKIVFNTDELNIFLDGNALDISFCGKLYENLSGGEKQRVDVIMQFAIRELLQAYFNYSSNILVLDEITDNLDKIATDKIFDLITSELKDVESIFIISHHDTELDIPVDTEIQVIKDENSISSIKEN